MKIAIISSSLNKKSQSMILSEYAKDYLVQRHNIHVLLINMKEFPLPLCCPDDVFDDPNVIKLKELLSSADSIIFSTPIYNFEVSSVLTNLLDLTGDAWREKLVGMMCTGGGFNSYMAVMNFANSLMLNFRCLIVPRFVYASQNVFNTDKKEITDIKIKKRIEDLSDKMVNLTQALRNSL